MAVLAGEVVAGEALAGVRRLGADQPEGFGDQLVAVGDQLAVGHGGREEARAVDAVVGPGGGRRGRSARRRGLRQPVQDEGDDRDRHTGAEEAGDEGIAVHVRDEAIKVVPETPRRLSTMIRNCRSSTRP